MRQLKIACSATSPLTSQRAWRKVKARRSERFRSSVKSVSAAVRRLHPECSRRAAIQHRADANPAFFRSKSFIQRLARSSQCQSFVKQTSWSLLVKRRLSCERSDHDQSHFNSVYWLSFRQCRGPVRFVRADVLDGHLRTYQHLPVTNGPCRQLRFH